MKNSSSDIEDPHIKDTREDWIKLFQMWMEKDNIFFLLCDFKYMKNILIKSTVTTNGTRAKAHGQSQEHVLRHIWKTMTVANNEVKIVSPMDVLFLVLARQTHEPALARGQKRDWL